MMTAPSRPTAASAAGAMWSALAVVGQGLDEVGAVELADLHVDDLASGAVALQRVADRVQVALARVLAEADRAAVWQGSGSKNAAGWLAGATKSDSRASMDALKLGDTLNQNASLAAKVDAGEISAATAIALHPVVTAPPDRATRADVDQLVQMCVGASPNDARRAAEVWKDGHRSATAEELAAERHAKRAVRFGAEVDGMVRTTADLPTLQAHLLRKALTSFGGRPADEDRRTTDQRLADALIALVDRSLGSANSGPSSNGAAVAGAPPGSGRQRVDLLVTIDVESFLGHDDPRDDRAGVDEFGGRIPSHLVRQLAEHASIARILHSGNQIIEHGRTMRLATDAQYRALIARDGNCRWPGCTVPASWCEVDHLVAWEHGGRTDLDNLVLFCSAHHTAKHMTGTRIIGDANDFELIRPDGVVMWCPPRGVASNALPGAPPIAPPRTASTLPPRSHPFEQPHVVLTG